MSLKSDMMLYRRVAEADMRTAKEWSEKVPISGEEIFKLPAWIGVGDVQFS